MKRWLCLGIVGIGLLVNGCSAAPAYMHPVKRLTHKFSQGWLNYSVELRNQQRPRAALMVLNLYMFFNSSNGFAYYVRGLVHYDQKQYRRAIADLSLAVDYLLQTKALDAQLRVLVEEAEYVYFYRARAYDHLNRREKAMADYTRALKINDKQIASYMARAEVYTRQGKEALAIQDYDRVIQIRPTVKALNNRAVAYSSLGEYAAAITDLDAALKITQDAFTYCNRGIVYWKCGLHAQAAADFIKTLKLDPQSAEAYYCLGDIYEQNKKNDQALQAYQQFLRIMKTGDFWKKSPSEAQQTAMLRNQRKAKAFIRKHRIKKPQSNPSDAQGK